MPSYHIITRYRSGGIYIVEADSKEDAKNKWILGDCERVGDLNEDNEEIDFVNEIK